MRDDSHATPTGDAQTTRVTPARRSAFDDEPVSSGSIFKDYDMLFVAGGCVVGFYLALSVLFWLGRNGFAPAG